MDVVQQPQAAACHWRCLPKTVLCQAGEGGLYPQATGGWSVTQYSIRVAMHGIELQFRRSDFQRALFYSSKIGLNAIIMISEITFRPKIAHAKNLKKWTQ